MLAMRSHVERAKPRRQVRAPILVQIMAKRWGSERNYKQRASNRCQLVVDLTLKVSYQTPTPLAIIPSPNGTDTSPPSHLPTTHYLLLFA
jgi:hypothetical protein